VPHDDANFGIGTLAEAVEAAYVLSMLHSKIATSKIATLALSGLFMLWAADAVSARPKTDRVKTDRVARSPASTAMQTCNGTPIIMQGLECRTGLARVHPNERAELPRRIPRGSSGYIAPVPSPTPPSLTLQRPPVGPYVPPPINSFSDRVTQCNHSFTFNAGVGNNPVGRDAYVRSCAN
jgi:hypothetical protein